MALLLSFIFHSLTCFRDHNFGAWTLRSLGFGSLFSLSQFLDVYFFQFKNFALHPWTFFIFFRNLKKNLKRIRCLKYKQGIAKVLKCSIFKIATCEAFLINTKMFKKKTKIEKLCIDKKKIPIIKTFFLHILYLYSKFLSFWFNYEFFF